MATSRDDCDDDRDSAPPARPAARGDRVIHEYDGIGEYDNDLPNWWLYSLFATIVFALGYFFWFQVFDGESSLQAYHREMQAEYAAEAARVRAAGIVTPAALLALSRDDATVRQGRDVFTSTCAACHGANAAGVIGPNLTDEFWLHGGAPDRVYQTVTNGVSARGMPAWGPQLGADRVRAVTAYLITLRNTNVAGRPPQGTREP
jgi:cytochrome c oxidase cbb3-type subunit 3